MAYITQFYTWASGNVITAARLNGNISNIVDGLNAGTKDINIAKLQIGGNDIIDSSQNITNTGDITTTSATSTKPIYTLKNINADSNGSEIQFYKLSASPADNDELGKITFYGDNDNTNKILYSQIISKSVDVSNTTEDGSLLFYSMKAGTSTLSFYIESGENIFSKFVKIWQDDPNANVELLRFDRTTASPADNDNYDINFYHENDNNEQEDYAKLKITALDVSDGTEKGKFTFSVADGVDGSMDEVISFDKDKVLISTALNLTLVSKTASYTANQETVILCDDTSNSITITLPTAVSNAGRIYTIKKIGANSLNYKVIIDGNGSETIDGYASLYLYGQYTFVTVQSNGTNWVIINKDTKIILSLGSWNMPATNFKTVNCYIPVTKILFVGCVIRGDGGRCYQYWNDQGTAKYRLDNDTTPTSIVVFKGTEFDGTDFDDTSITRGYLTVDLVYWE